MNAGKITAEEFEEIMRRYDAKGPIEDTLRHFGYSESREVAEFRQHWDKSEYLKNLLSMPEFINIELKHKKFKMVLDYDPDYPNALIQFFEGGNL